MNDIINGPSNKPLDLSFEGISPKLNHRNLLVDLAIEKGEMTFILTENMHLRPATELVVALQPYSPEKITFQVGEEGNMKQALANSVLSIVLLGAAKGVALKVAVASENARGAWEAILSLSHWTPIANN